MEEKRKYNPELKAEATKMDSEQGMLHTEVRVHEGQQTPLPDKTYGEGLHCFSSGLLRLAQAKPSARERANGELKAKIKRSHDDSRATYGTKRIKVELAADCTQAGRDSIGRLRKEMRLGFKQNRKFRAATNSNHNFPTALILFNQRFSPITPGMVWGTGIAFILTDEGWLYLAGVKNFKGKEFVGGTMGDRVTKEFVRTALAKTRAFRTPLPGCIHHSDRGSQYRSPEYRHDAEVTDFRVPLSRKGNFFDNAPMESLWGLLKQEVVHHRRFAAHEETMAAIQKYFEEICLSLAYPLLIVQVRRTCLKLGVRNYE